MRTSYQHTEVIHNLNAPREVVPLIMSLVNPKNVLDIGCGTGTWLKAFEEHGILDYLGVDGDLDKKLLKIPDRQFVVQDLRQPFSLHRKFDLVISLEVAEHLDEKYADQFVKTLVSHGNTILFSAAIPGQGGQHHLNEQWPEYWEEKFEQHGLFFHDNIRPLIWQNKKVDWWYKQNMFLITTQKPVDWSNGANALVHPELYRKIISEQSEAMESLRKGKHGLKSGARIFGNSLIHKFKSLLGWQ